MLLLFEIRCVRASGQESVSASVGRARGREGSSRLDGAVRDPFATAHDVATDGRSGERFTDTGRIEDEQIRAVATVGEIAGNNPAKPSQSLNDGLNQDPSMSITPH